MRNVLLQLLNMTEDITANINKAAYEELESLVQQREYVISELSAQWDKLSLDDQTEIGRTIEKICSYDSILLGIMERLKLTAAEELQKIALLKKQQQAYSKGGVYDSLFFDKRK